MPISSEWRSIQSLVEDIKEDKLLLPELQRPYIWKSTQVRNLFDSLYRGYPSGQILIWETENLPFARGVSVEGAKPEEGRHQLLLDGQQRLTSLAAIMLNRPLIVRGSKRPIDIVFNVHSEKFEVAGPRQSGETGWISLSKLFSQGAISILFDLKINTATPEAKQILERLTRVENIRNYSYNVNELRKLSYEEVTHIFVRINSGGTKLGGADLALAQISSRWHGVTRELEAFQKQVKRLGLEIDTGILLRTMSVFISGTSTPSQLFLGERQTLTVETLQETWERVKNGILQAIPFLINNCQIDKLDLLPTQYVLIPLAAYFDRFGGRITAHDARELQLWTYMALIWSRYSTSSESAVDQDVNALKQENPIQAMIQNIEAKVGHRPVTERELREQRKNSPFMLMAYVLARNAHAQDWFNSIAIGGNQALEFHHIFPKEILREEYDLKGESRTVDQVANLAFLTQKPSVRIRKSSPIEYLTAVDVVHLRAQFVPTDETLWTLEHFQDFVRERRTLLAEAMNQLLQGLRGEPTLWVGTEQEILEGRIRTIEQQIRELIEERLSEARGDQAWEYCIPKSIRDALEFRANKHWRKNPFDHGEDATLAEKLTFSQFSDYPKIVGENWLLFQDLFGDAERFKQHFANVTDLRNAFAHPREVPRSEKAIGEGSLMWLEDCLRKWDAERSEELSDDENEV